MLDKFLELYKANGVLDVSGQRLVDKPLHEACPDRRACWAGHEPGPRLSQWNKIQIPFIGPLYWQTPAGLVVIGQNLNENGGVFSVSQLVVSVQSIVSSGQSKR